MDGEKVGDSRKGDEKKKVVGWGSSPVLPPHIFLREGYNLHKPTIKVRRVFGANSILVANTFFIFPSVSL